MISWYPDMDVLKTTSPTTVPARPNAKPSISVPSARTIRALGVGKGDLAPAAALTRSRRGRGRGRGGARGPRRAVQPAAEGKEGVG